MYKRQEEELGEMNVPPPYWAFAWAGGQALARYILDVPEAVAGKAVLDIGSGSGLVALAAKLAGAKSAMANDIDPFANAACALNAKANRLTIEINGSNILDPYDDDADRAYHNAIGPAETIGSETLEGSTVSLVHDIASYNVICLGDTFYEEALAIDALFFIESAHAAGARVLVGDPSRSYFPTEHFRKITEYQVPVTRELEDNDIKNTAVWAYAG